MTDERQELAEWCLTWYIGAHSLQMDAVVVGILHRIAALLREPPPGVGLGGTDMEEDE